MKNPKGIGFKKKIPIVFNLRVLKIKRKEYSGYGSLLNFMLEEVLDFGPSNLGKFASNNMADVEALYENLRSKIMAKRKRRGL